jgi:hypothetical protein
LFFANHSELCNKTKAMKKLLIPQYIRNNSFLSIVIICMLSCTNHEKEYTNSFYKMEYPKEDPIIDFNTVDCLNESNRRVIQLSGISFRLAKDVKTLELLLKIQKDHQKIDSKLNNLAKDNLIIIPKVIYHLNGDCVKNKNFDSIFKELESEIKNQIILFDSIEKNTTNIDFKAFSVQSKKILRDNNLIIKTLLSNQ